MSGTVRLENLIEKVHVKLRDYVCDEELTAYGVSNTDGITQTTHRKSEDLGEYLVIEPGSFAYNPYRINVGSIGLTPDNVTGLVSPAYIVFRVKKGRLVPEILLDFLKSSEGLRQINKLARGAVRKALRYDDLCEIEFPDISFERQLEILQYKKVFNKQHGKLLFEIAHQQSLLAKLKQAILQEAIQGKLTADLPVRQAGWRSDSFLNLSDKRVPEQSDAYFAYVLECADGSLYKGFCQNLWERIDLHLAGKGADWTTKTAPVALIHFEQLEDLAAAKKREEYFNSCSGREWLKCLHQERRSAYEPASQLLQKIEKARSQWIATAKAKGDYEAKTIERKLAKLRTSLTTKPIDDLPSSWEWATLIEANLLIVDCHNKTAPYESSGIPIIRTTNVRNGVLDLEETKYISEQTYMRWTARCIPLPGDLIFTREAPVGEIGQIPEGARVCLGQRTMLIRPIPQFVLPAYLLIAIQAPDFMQRASRVKRGAMVGHLRVGDVETAQIPLPPLAEQATIVERVKALMTTCRELEAEIEHARTHAAHLLQAVLKEAFAPAYV